ncbi:MAG: hypothetical protein U0641_02740 [Anaerolineae bacterium]
MERRVHHPGAGYAPFAQIVADLPWSTCRCTRLLLHAWFANSRVAGSADTALRFPSVIWGELAVHSSTCWASASGAASDCSARCFALNPFQVWYSRTPACTAHAAAALSIAALWALDVGLPCE